MGNGQQDGALRTTVNSCSYSTVSGEVPMLDYVFPSSGVIPTKTEMTLWAPTGMGKQGISFGIPRGSRG